MCAPMAIMGIASLAFQMYGSMQQSRAMEQQAEYEEAVQRNNNIMAERAAQDAERRGRREETLRRMQISQDVGTQKSALAGSGFDVNTGSALTKQSDIRAMGDVEALTIRSNKQREINEIRRGNYAERANSAGRVSSLKNKAKSTLISGAASVASGAFGMYNQGMFGGGTPTAQQRSGPF